MQNDLHVIFTCKFLLGDIISSQTGVSGVRIFPSKNEGLLEETFFFSAEKRKVFFLSLEQPPSVSYCQNLH